VTPRPTRAATDELVKLLGLWGAPAPEAEPRRPPRVWMGGAEDAAPPPGRAAPAAPQHGPPGSGRSGELRPKSGELRPPGPPSQPDSGQVPGIVWHAPARPAAAGPRAELEGARPARLHVTASASPPHAGGAAWIPWSHSHSPLQGPGSYSPGSPPATLPQAPLPPPPVLIGHAASLTPY